MSGKRKLSDFWGPQAPANPVAAHAASSHVNTAAAAAAAALASPQALACKPQTCLQAEPQPK